MLTLMPLGCCKVAELVRAHTPCTLICVDGLQAMSSLAGCDGNQCLLFRVAALASTPQTA